MNSNIERREGTSGARPTAEPGVDGATEQHQPGEWPEGCRRNTFADEAWLKVQAERARRDVFLGAVRADLEEQPSPRAVRAAGHRWSLRLLQVAEDVAKAKEGS